MKKTRFGKIFNKYIGKPEEAHRLVDDMGPMRGIFGYRGYDVRTGQPIGDPFFCNSLTNLSRSTVIRLLGRGTSPWITGTMDQSSLAIASMRFGVNSISVPDTQRKYLYYDIGEASSFDVTTLGGTGVGGDFSKATYGANFGAGGVATVVTKRNTQAQDGYISLEPSGDAGSTHQYKTYIVCSTQKPPSQFSLKVEFISGGAVKEAAFFNSIQNWTGNGSALAVPPYVRAANGSPVTHINTTSGASQVLYRGSSSASSWIIDPYASVRVGATMLYYDYAAGTWNVLVDELNNASYETVRISFMIGKYNVVNNIVPRIGTNKGSGMTIADRYGSTTGDSYPIVATREYRDCDTDFIDDYAVTFAVNMTANDGNGTASASSGQQLKYTQAYLFNGRDEMFSSIQLSSDNAFVKNSNYAYYVTWQILAPVN